MEGSSLDSKSSGGKGGSDNERSPCDNVPAPNPFTVDVDVLGMGWKVEVACWFMGLLMFEEGVDDIALLFSSREVRVLALSLFNVIIGIGLSSETLRAVDDCNDAGFLLPGSGVIDRETRLSPPLLAGVATKSAADEELDAAGPADRLRHVTKLS